MYYVWVMIIEFSILNFRSFRDLETLSLVAAPIRSKDKELDTNATIAINNKLTLLRSKAIYGSNASGKSNIIKAFVSFKRLVRLSVRDETAIKQTCDDFVLHGNVDVSPVFYQLLFIHQDVSYRYGFEVMENRVVSEWLYKNGTLRGEVKLFTREGMKVSVNQAQFGEAKKFENVSESGESDIFQPHSLFLSATAAVAVKLSKELQQAINDISVANSTDPALKQYSTRWWMDDANRKRGIELLQAADTGVEEIGIIEDDIRRTISPEQLQLFQDTDVPKKISRLTSIRKIFRDDKEPTLKAEMIFDAFESEGTKKFSYLVPLILIALENGTALWIDEFDASLHPKLTKKIVSLFHSVSTNPKGAQLVFATHDTNMLKASFLRRDQICFVEKDKSGVSHLKTLVEYKGIRNDASYDKDYLQGKYGAVPFLNELDEAVEKGIVSRE